MERQKLVVLSGAGMSAESGIGVFRGAGGLWEGHRAEDVATPGAWERDPQLVLRFYNERRKQIINAEPNAGHKALAQLETDFDVHIVTQNIDDLHERAGSQNVLHLHGEIMKARSTAHPELLYDLDHWEMKWGDRCERGAQLRPHVVWFGEEVPMIEPAAQTVSDADIVVIVGTSLLVYPAAGLLHYAPSDAKLFCIDPEMPSLPHRDPPIRKIKEGASAGLEVLRSILAGT